MEIHGPSGISGPERPELKPAEAQSTDKAVSSDKVADQVQISEQAQLLEKLSQVPAVRMEKVAELKRLIEAGEYETSERIEGAARKLLEEL
jgi:flagellar biosynthesis anti-sigma factor FlgM